MSTFRSSQWNYVKINSDLLGGAAFGSGSGLTLVENIGDNAALAFTSAFRIGTALHGFFCVHLGKVFNAFLGLGKLRGYCVYFMDEMLFTDDFNGVRAIFALHSQMVANRVWLSFQHFVVLFDVSGVLAESTGLSGIDLLLIECRSHAAEFIAVVRLALGVTWAFIGQVFDLSGQGGG